MYTTHSFAAPGNAAFSFRARIAGAIKKLKRRYLILKIKWFLLFVLPILLIVIAYQTAKQLLKIRIKQLSMNAANETAHQKQRNIEELKN